MTDEVTHAADSIFNLAQDRIASDADRHGPARRLQWRWRQRRECGRPGGRGRRGGPRAGIGGCSSCRARGFRGHHAAGGDLTEIGRASCRERGGQYVEITVVAGTLKKKKKN